MKTQDLVIGTPSTVRYGTVRYGTVRYGTVRYGNAISMVKELLQCLVRFFPRGQCVIVPLPHLYLNVTPGFKTKGYEAYHSLQKSSFSRFLNRFSSIIDV